MVDLVTVGTTAACLGLAAWLKLTGRGTRDITYHLKFGGMALTIGLLATLTWPLMILRGKKPDYVWFNLPLFALYGRKVMGIQWEFANSDDEIQSRLLQGKRQLPSKSGISLLCVLM